ncbi:hypothetical protein L596_012170 [Steinernema carpocapsae]|uniref:Uncharacterized protein n=1 Tax=Steinernema carpocapsae TaxID=34508 RepID=A0A4U5NX40_STECR|nr:hypothetical protein L596_012170 [Steinernema carpocapsae]
MARLRNCLLLLLLVNFCFANHMYLNPDYKDIIGQDYWDKLTQNAEGEDDPCYRKHCPIGNKCFAIPNPRCRRIECPMIPTCVDIGEAGK